MAQFCALRLYESTTPQPDLVRATRALVDRGVKHISKDLIWKLWFECAQVEERNGHLQRARSAYVRSVANCAANLRWKVWLGGARTELCHGQFETARALLDRAFAESPPKTRALAPHLATLGHLEQRLLEDGQLALDAVLPVSYTHLTLPTILLV